MKLLFFVLLVLAGMLAADHWMRTALDRAPSWFPFAVNAAGALAGFLCWKLLLWIFKFR